MLGKSKWPWLGSGLGVVFSVLLISTLALAGSNSTTLPNGAELAVSVDDPVSSTEFKVPAGEADIDVDVTGTASVGLGEPDATFVYVIDVSGSTDGGSGTGCAPILDCEQEFIKALNQAAIADGSVDEVGVVVYADSGATADMSSAGGDQIIVAPDADTFVNTVVDSTFSDYWGGDGGVAQFTNKAVGQLTNCSAGLTAALNVVNASTNGTNVVVFVSDGLCNTGPAIGPAVTALANAGAVINSIAAGDGSDCTSNPGGRGSLQDMADATGGECFEVPDPGNLPDIIPSLIGSTLESLQIEVDSGGKNPISNDDIDPDLPQPGAANVDYTTTVSDLDPADHEICVTANGSDVTGGTASVTQCETIHLLQLTATPPTESNELGLDNSHTVTAEIVGGSGPTRDIHFVVAPGGSNAATPPNASIPADPNEQVQFDYTVPKNCLSLGTDTITVSTVIAGMSESVDVTKDWVDTTPPVPQCVETVNPHGGTVPPAGSTTLPGPKGGKNEDGFYELLAEDDLEIVPGCEIVLHVIDSGSGTMFGPFSVGDKIKYTEAPTAVPTSKKIGSTKGQAGAIAAHIIGNGDLVLQATDVSGNTATVSCLVPPPPK